MTKRSTAIASEATRIMRELRAQARPPGDFDASRYFRTTTPLEFLNVRTQTVRALGKSTVRQHKEDWTAREALAFADRLIQEPHLEVKGVGIEALACFRTRFTPAMLPAWKRWLASDLAANWATTDSICGSLIAPLLIAHPHLIRVVNGWASHRNMWVRRAAAVSLVRLAARGVALEDAYGVATALRGDTEDLVHKAAGWLLREAGRTDMARLERYLRTNGRSISRTTIRYAIERFPAAKRRALLAATRLVPSNP